MLSKTVKTINRCYPQYRKWLNSNFKYKASLDVVTPVGLKCSQIYKIGKSKRFNLFEKSNKDVRLRYNNENYIKILSLRNLVTNRKKIKVTNRKVPEYISDDTICSLLKWPGGKQREFRILLNNNPEMFPQKINTYYEPFVGGGAVYFSMKADNLLINDKCGELIQLYKMIKNRDTLFYNALNNINSHWNAVSKLIDRESVSIIDIYNRDESFVKFLSKHRDKLLTGIWCGQDHYVKLLGKIFIQKLTRVKTVEKKHGKMNDEDILANVEGAIKATSYTFFRDIYNNSSYYKLASQEIVICFYFLRDYCFSSMFRFNKDGHFNVPYGGISYNRKNPDFRKDLWQSDRVVSHLNKTKIECLDFEQFFQNYPPQSEDFVFVDPPYDSEFSTYAQNKFGKQEHKCLAKLLLNCKANFMLIIKNTEFISELYDHETISRIPFSKKYSVSFMNRNDQKVEHLIIKNY